MEELDGILRCSKYAFGPNRLHYCGPDANAEILSYIQNSASDPGLATLLKAFRTMFPYLRLIAEANNVKDVFNPQVVEAYWIGNKLLEQIPKKKLYNNLVEAHELKKKLGLGEFFKIEDKIGLGALPHHSFHVFNIWKRTGNLETAHTLESMDECRISWGEILEANGPFLRVKTEPLIFENGQLGLGAPMERKIIRKLDSPSEIDNLKSGDTVSIHWGVPCEALTRQETLNLRKYTLKSIAVANGIKMNI